MANVPTKKLKVAGKFGSYGEPGVTFTPDVSEDGVLSWTNDGGLENPAPVNVKGDTGERGPSGATTTLADAVTVADVTTTEDVSLIREFIPETYQKTFKNYLVTLYPVYSTENAYSGTTHTFKIIIYFSNGGNTNYTTPAVNLNNISSFGGPISEHLYCDPEADIYGHGNPFRYIPSDARIGSGVHITGVAFFCDGTVSSFVPGTRMVIRGWC